MKKLNCFIEKNFYLERQCNPIGALENGRFNEHACAIGPTFYTTVCYPSCNEGYELDTEHGRYTCGFDRKWTPLPTDLRCKRKFCNMCVCVWVCKMCVFVCACVCVCVYILYLPNVLVT